mmetsp:Transcript_20178/g.80543  ORF Transcript_20178/g.80543 Transcript_20178/m.80543 type:complete len:200 (-) Transcript_20178:301-900(-)
MVVSRHETIEIRVDGALRWTHREAHGGEPQALEYHIGASPRSAIRGEFAATGPRAILELRRSDESRSSSRSGGRRALEHVHEVRIDLPALDVERRTDRANLRAAPGIQLADDAPRRGPHVAVVPARRGRPASRRRDKDSFEKGCVGLTLRGPELRVPACPSTLRRRPPSTGDPRCARDPAPSAVCCSERRRASGGASSR